MYLGGLFQINYQILNAFLMLQAEQMKEEQKNELGFEVENDNHFNSDGGKINITQFIYFLQ